MIGRTVFLWLCIVLISATGCTSDSYFKYFDSPDEIRSYEKKQGSAEIALDLPENNFYCFIVKESDALYRYTTYKLSGDLMEVEMAWGPYPSTLVGPDVLAKLDFGSYPSLDLNENALREKATSIDSALESTFAHAESKIVSEHDLSAVSGILSWKQYTNGDISRKDFSDVTTLSIINTGSDKRAFVRLAYSLRQSP